MNGVPPARGAGSDPLAETSTSDTNPVQYIFFGGKRIARLDPGTSAPKFYVEDNVGSTELVTDSLGNPLSESLFYPYGFEQQILANDSNTYKFSGKERDSETGLDDFGARYYASNLGRFMSPDWDAKPAAVPFAIFGDPQTLNLYSYVDNAPVNRVDAEGHMASTNVENIWTPNGCVQGDRACFDFYSDGALTLQPAENQGTPQDQQQIAAQSDATTQAANASIAMASAQQTYGHQPDGTWLVDTRPGSEVGNILDPVHPSNPGPITSSTDSDGQCVTATQHYAKGLPSTDQWSRGDPVMIQVNGKWVNNPAVKSGTAIATFDSNGKYFPGSAHKNSGIYLGPGLFSPSNGRILDQWPGSPGPRPRDIWLTGGLGDWDVSNHSNAYFAIKTP